MDCWIPSLRAYIVQGHPICILDKEVKRMAGKNRATPIGCLAGRQQLTAGIPQDPVVRITGFCVVLDRVVELPVELGEYLYSFLCRNDRYLVSKVVAAGL